MDEATHKRFTDLEVWKKARACNHEIRTLVKYFPKEEKYRLTDQLIRSARSITATIAEGHGRYTYRDQINYCIMARVSLKESLAHVIEAFDCKYIDETKLILLRNSLIEIERLLNGYITFLRKNLQNK